MQRQIEFEGVTHEFPNEATPEQIKKALTAYKARTSAPTPLNGMDQAKQGGMELLSGFNDTLNPLQGGSSAIGTGVGIQLPYDAASKFKQLLIDPSMEQANQSATGFDKMRNAPDAAGKFEGGMDWIAHSIGTIPLIGPAIGTAYETSKTSPMRGIGQLLGIIAPEIAGRFANRIAPSTPSGSPVPLTSGEKAGSPFIKKIEHSVEQSAGGAGPFKKFRSSQQAAINVMADSLLNDISNFKGSTEELGKFIDERFKAYTKEHQIPIGEPGTPIPPRIVDTGIESTLPVEPTALNPRDVARTMPFDRAKFGAEAGPFEGASHNLDNVMDTQDQMAGHLKPWFEEPSGLSLDEATERLKQRLEGGKPAIPNTLDTGNGLTSEENMAKFEEAMKNAPQPGSTESRLESAITADIIKAALKKNPDLAYKMLLSPRISVERVGIIKQIVGPDAFRAMSAQVVRDFLRDTKDAEIGIPGGAVQRTEQFRGLMQNRLTRGTMGPRLQAILSPTEFDKLMDIAKIGKSLEISTSRWLSYLDRTIMGTAAIGSIFTHSIGGVALSMASGAASEVALNVTARLMTRPEGATTIRELVRALGRNDTKRVIFYTNRVQDIVEREFKRDFNKEDKSLEQGKPMPPPPG